MKIFGPGEWRERGIDVEEIDFPETDKQADYLLFVPGNLQITQFLPKHKMENPWREIASQCYWLFLSRGTSEGDSHESLESIDLAVYSFATQQDIEIEKNRTQSLGLRCVQKLFAPQFPNEIWFQIAQQIHDGKDVANFAAVCSKFRSIVRFDEKLRMMQEGLYRYCIGKSIWEKYIGFVGDEPRFPDGTCELMKGFCPYKERMVEGTYMLIMIPSHIDGVPLTLEWLGKLVRHPKAGLKARYHIWNPGGNEKISPRKSYWIPITTEEIPREKRMIYIMGKEKQSPKFSPGYRLPKLLEAVSVSFLAYVSGKREIFAKKSYTLCEETFKDTRLHMVVGGARKGKLNVTCESESEPNKYGWAAVRNLEETPH